MNPQGFLAQLFHDAPSTGTIAFTSLLAGTSPRHWFVPVADIHTDRVAQWITAEDREGRNVYVRCTALRGVPSTGSRGTRSDTLGAGVLWVDIDYKRTSQQTAENLLSKLPEPNIVVNSGGGLHVYWQIPWTTDVVSIERANRALANAVQADDCWSASQILRVPGTYNYKYSPAPIVTVISTTEGVHQLDQFPRMSVSRDIDPAIDPEELPEGFLDRLPETLRNRVVDGVTKAHEPIDNRSQSDWYIALKLLELGHSPGIALSVLSHPTWASGNKTREAGHNYACYTVASALAHNQRTRPSMLARVFYNVFQETGLLWVDEKGNPRKTRPIRGTDLVQPVVEALLVAGVTFYVDRSSGDGYMVTPEGRVIIVNEDSQEFRHWLTINTGFGGSETEHNMLRYGLAAYAHEMGTSAQLHPWCHLDRTDKTFYVLLDADGHTMLRVARGAYEVLPNGTDGCLLRRSGCPYSSIDWLPNTPIPYGLGLLIQEFTRYLATDVALQSLLTCYCLALPLLHGYPIQTYPLLHITGRSGSGKSQTAMLISTLLYGSPQLLNTTPAASYRVASREVVLMFDDWENLPEAVQQFILTSSTGIRRQMAGFGQGVINQEAHVPIGLTSIAPLDSQPLRRRALVVPVDRSTYSGPPYSEDHWRTLSDVRSDIWSAYAVWLSEAFLPNVSDTHIRETAKAIESILSSDIFKGLAPFLSLCWHIGLSIEHVCPGFLPQREHTLSAWCSALSMTSDVEIEESNPLLQAIESVF